MTYAFGSNGSGQLGIGHLDDTASPQSVVLQGDAVSIVKKIVAGGNHTLILNYDGKVYAAGSNDDGRCGGPSGALFTTATDGDLSAIGAVIDVSATWSASFFLAIDHRTIFTCGTGEHGELGLGMGVTHAEVPTKLASFGEAKIVSLRSSVSHTLVVLDNGEVWGWGKGRRGQLEEPAEDQWRPKPLKDLHFAAVMAVAGADFSCILGQTGEILVLGSDKRDRFRLRAGAPSVVPMPTSLFASWGTIYALSDGQLTCWGRDDRGQIPPALPKLIDFCAGSEHWIALSAAGKVLTGGWGEHGNCGADTDAKGVVKGRLNTIAIEGTVVRVFAGCATSFIVVDQT